MANVPSKFWLREKTVVSNVMYDCEICGAFHPWEYDGDCRNDFNRFGDPEDYAKLIGIDVDDLEIRSMDERVEADAS